MERMALLWQNAYVKIPRVTIAANSMRLPADLVQYGPAYLPIAVLWHRGSPAPPDLQVLDVGCFGAIRPRKNQLAQAFAAIAYAEAHKIPMRPIRFVSHFPRRAPS